MKSASGAIRALTNGQQITVRLRHGWYVVDDVKTGAALTSGFPTEAAAWAEVETWEPKR